MRVCKGNLHTSVVAYLSLPMSSAHPVFKLLSSKFFSALHFRHCFIRLFAKSSFISSLFSLFRFLCISLVNFRGNDSTRVRSTRPLSMMSMALLSSSVEYFIAPCLRTSLERTLITCSALMSCVLLNSAERIRLNLQN